MEKSLGSAWSIYKETWALYKQYLGAIVILSSIPAVFFLTTQVIIAYNENLLLGFALALSYFIVTVLSILTLAMVLIADTPTFTAAYKKGTGLFVPVLLIGLLATLTVLGGGILFIIPGIYVGILLSLWVYALINEDRRGIGALVQSWYLVKGAWWNVFRKQLFLLLGTLVPMVLFAMIFGVLAFIVAGANIFEGLPGETTPFQTINDELFSLYIAGPLSLLFGKILYQRIKALKPGEFSPEEAAKVKRNIILLTGLTIAVTVLLIGLGLVILWSMGLLTDTTFPTAPLKQ